MRRNEDGFIRPDDEMDPAVTAAIGRDIPRQAQSQQITAKERDRKRKQRIKNQKQQPRRMDLLIDPSVKAWINQAGQDLHCTSSQVAEFAFRYLIAAVENGTVDLQEFIEPLPHPFYTQKLIYPTVSKKG
jgi:hypothetical protein